MWKFYGDWLTDRVRLLAFVAKLCTSSGVKLLRRLPNWPRTTTGFCCETLHQFWSEIFTVIAWQTTFDYWLLLQTLAPVLVWNFYGDCLTDYLRLLAFDAKLFTSSDAKVLRWLPDWPHTTTRFCCQTLHQFWCRCETFSAIAWLTTYDYWLLLRIFAPVLVKLLRRLPDWLPTTFGFCCETLHQFCVWIFYSYCLTDHLRLLALAAKFCASSGVKLLRWLPDCLSKVTGFCCEKLCTSSGVKLLRWFAHLVLTIIGFCCETLHQLWWNFYGDCLTDYLRLLGLAAKFCTSSGVKLLRWLPDRQPTPTGFCCETLHQFWCETFKVIAWLTT